MKVPQSSCDVAVIIIFVIITEILFIFIIIVIVTDIFIFITVYLVIIVILLFVPQSSTAAPVEEAAQALRVKRCAFWNFYKTVFYHFWSTPSYFCFYILWFRILLFLIYGFCMEFFESLSLPSTNSALMLIALKQLFRLLWLFWLFFPQHEYSFINMLIFSPTWSFLHHQAGWRRHPERLRSKHCHRRIPSLPTVQVRLCLFLFSPWFPTISNTSNFHFPFY